MEQEKLSEIAVSIILASNDCLPEEVTAITGLQPTESWRIGDIIKGTGRPYKRNGWLLATRLDSDADLEEHVRALLKSVEHVVPTLSELSKNWDIELNCTVYVGSYVPSLHFDRDIIQILASIGAQIDIDLYCS
jgi:hypothetical protein